MEILHIRDISFQLPTHVNSCVQSLSATCYESPSILDYKKMQNQSHQLSFLNNPRRGKKIFPFFHHVSKCLFCILKKLTEELAIEA